MPVDVQSYSPSLPPSQQQIAAQQRLAQALSRQAARQPRFTHPQQALAPFGQNLAAAIAGARARGMDNQRQQSLAQALAGKSIEGIDQDTFNAYAQHNPEDALTAYLNAQGAAAERQRAAQAAAVQRQQQLQDAQAEHANAKELHMFKNANRAPTSDMQEYEFAKSQGYEGSFSDYQLAQRKAGSNNMTINNGPQGAPIPEYNKLPAGYVYKRGPDGQVLIGEGGVPTAVPITGGPAAQEAEAAAGQEQKRRELAKRGADIVTQDIDRALSIIGGEGGGFIPETGLIGSIAANIPGTDAHNVANLIDTLRANTGFDKLQSMREASPTGGALGQVSEQENKLLQAAIGNLSQSQDKQQLIDNLNRVHNIYSATIHGEGNYEPRALSFENAGLPSDVTEEDIAHTMKLHGLTREQVLERLKK